MEYVVEELPMARQKHDRLFWLKNIVMLKGKIVSTWSLMRLNTLKDLL